MENRNLLWENNDGVVLVTVNRPAVLNSLDDSVLDDLIKLFGALGEDAAVKVVVLTGAGAKAFVAGADIAAMAQITVQQALEFARKGQRLVNLIGKLSQPVIAAVNGFALGGGLELALACDFIYASENAKLGLPEVTLGVIPGFGGTQKLGRRIGTSRASEMIFTGRVLSAAEARDWGIVNVVVPAGELLEKAMETATRIAGNGLLGVAHAKKSIRSGLDMAEKDGMDYEALLFASLFATEDQKEGMAAFLGKRKAAFTGA